MDRATIKNPSTYHANSRLDVPIIFQKIMFDPSEIEDDVKIGIGIVIMHGVMLRRGANYCQGRANVLATKSFPEFSVMAGAPVKNNL